MTVRITLPININKLTTDSLAAEKMGSFVSVVGTLNNKDNVYRQGKSL